MWIVEVEEECGEAQRDVLLRGGAEGGTQQLHACYGDEERSAAGGVKKIISHIFICAALFCMMRSQSNNHKNKYVCSNKDVK